MISITEQLIETIERFWHLSNVDIGDLQVSNAADVYLMKADQGLFLLKFLSAEVDDGRVERYISILNHLNKHDFPAPRLLASCEGKHYAQWEGRSFYILHYIEGRIIEESEEEEYELGRMASRLHKVTGYPHKSGLITKEALLSYFHGSLIKAEYDKLILSLPDFSDDKQVLIHTDLCPTNALWTQNNKLVLIDFDNAGMGARSLDIGYPLLTQFIDYEGRLPMQPPEKGAKLYFKENIARAFYSGYFADSVPDETEKELLFSGAIQNAGRVNIPSAECN